MPPQISRTTARQPVQQQQQREASSHCCPQAPVSTLCKHSWWSDRCNRLTVSFVFVSEKHNRGRLSPPFCLSSIKKNWMSHKKKKPDFDDVIKQKLHWVNCFWWNPAVCVCVRVPFSKNHLMAFLSAWRLTLRGCVCMFLHLCRYTVTKDRCSDSYKWHPVQHAHTHTLYTLF